MAGFEYVRAFTIHVFTATGAALALLALILGTGGHWAGMFLCLGLALVVDGADGPLARAFEVQKLVPRWSGEILDLVVDFTTYVFVTAYAIAASGLLPQPLAIPAGIIVVISAASPHRSPPAGNVAAESTTPAAGDDAEGWDTADAPAVIHASVTGPARDFGRMAELMRPRASMKARRWSGCWPFRPAHPRPRRGQPLHTMDPHAAASYPASHSCDGQLQTVGNITRR